MKRTFFWTATLLVLLMLCCKKTNAATGFRVIGYLPAYALNNGTALSFDFSKVTHVNIAFINPDKDGRFAINAGLAAVISAAHAKQVKVLVSIGGGSAPAYYSALMADSMRAGFISNIVKLVADNDLDGIDVDLEGERIDNNYEAFVTELSVAVKSAGKLLTAAVATVYQSRYTDKALAKYDFINIMSYDKTGPWNLLNPGQHAPYDMAVVDLDYWANTRGIPKNKLNLGVPFYGYGFGKGVPSEIGYRDLITQYTGAEQADEVTVGDGGTIYYNGLLTIRRKTALALKNVGGIMIWQLMQDAGGSKSLLDGINAVINNN